MALLSAFRCPGTFPCGTTRRAAAGIAIEVRAADEKIGVDRAAAALGSTVALPDHVSIAIDTVIVSDFVASTDVAEGHYMADSIDRSDVSIRVARVVNVPLGNLHPDRLSAR
jgi:hypothetical protein